MATLKQASSVDVHAHAVPIDGLDEMRRLSDTVPCVVSGEGNSDDSIYLMYPSGVKSGPLPTGMIDVGVRLSDMDRMGISEQVLSVRPILFGVKLDPIVEGTLARLQNDALIDLATQEPKRFSVLVTLPVGDVVGAVNEVQRVANMKLVRGVILNSHIGGRNLDEPDLDELWYALEEADLPVLIHPFQSEVLGIERLGRHYLHNLVGNPVESTVAVASRIFGGVLDRHEDLRVCAVHGGGVAPWLSARWDHGYGCREESSGSVRPPSFYLRSRIWVDSVLHDPRLLGVLGSMVGFDRLLLGSDYPFDMGLGDPAGNVCSGVFDDDVREGILWRNSENFLR